MFIEPSELTTAMYGHVINEIAANDDAVVIQGIEAATQEVKSYLKNRYDVDTIFSQTGDNRNALIVESIKTVAVWWIIRVCSAETIYSQWLERYDRVIDYLKGVANGTNTPELPLKADSNGDVVLSMRYGSNRKFNHEM